jgi:hypothetical protein
LQSYSTVVENNLEVPCYVQGSSLVIENNGVGVAGGSPLTLMQDGVAIASLGTVQNDGTDIADSDGDGFGYELMTYAVATLTAANKYTLQATGSGNFLRRSIFDAPSSSGIGVDHPSGSRFAVVGPGSQGILKMTMPPAYIGQTLYFKVCSFNTFGAALQSLGDVAAYPYTPTGVPGADPWNIVTGDYMALPTDDIIAGNSTSPLTITLPVTGFTGDLPLYIGNINTGVVTVVAASGNISGQASIALNQWQFIHVSWDGSQWVAIGEALSV